MRITSNGEKAASDPDWAAANTVCFLMLEMAEKHVKRATGNYLIGNHFLGQPLSIRFHYGHWNLALSPGKVLNHEMVLRIPQVDMMNTNLRIGSRNTPVGIWQT